MDSVNFWRGGSSFCTAAPACLLLAFRATLAASTWKYFSSTNVTVFCIHYLAVYFLMLFHLLACKTCDGWSLYLWPCCRLKVEHSSRRTASRNKLHKNCREKKWLFQNTQLQRPAKSDAWCETFQFRRLWLFSATFWNISAASKRRFKWLSFLLTDFTLLHACDVLYRLSYHFYHLEKKTVWPFWLWFSLKLKHF